MKTLKSFVWMLAMTAAILTASCSGSGSVEAKLDKYVPDDVDLVFTGDIQRAVEATGSTIEDGAIKPSAMLEDMIGTMSAGDRDILRKFLSFKGMDWTNGVVAVRLNGMNPEALFIWSVTNEKEFARSMAEATHDKGQVGNEDGYVTFGDEESALVFKDNMGFCVFTDNNMAKASTAIRIVESWASNASEKPLASWKKDCLASEHIFNMMMNGKIFEMATAIQPTQIRALYAQMPELKGMMDKMSKGVISGYLDLDGQSLRAEASLLDGEGKDLDFGIDYKEINTDLLKYGTSKDLAVFGFGSGKLFADQIMKIMDGNVPADAAGIIKSVLGGIDGSIVAMFGPATDNLVDLQTTKGWTLTGVIEYADAAKAGAALDAIADILKTAGSDELSVAAHQAGSSADVVVITEDYSNASFDYDTYEMVGVEKVSNNLSLRVDGKNLVISTSKQNGDGCGISKDLISGSYSALAIEIPKDNKLFSLLHVPFGVKGNIVSKESHATLDITLTDTKDNFLTAIFRLIGSKA